MNKGRELLELKGRIREKKTNYRELAEKTGISVSSLCNKVNGKSYFDISEVAKISNCLQIPPEEIQIFFT